MRFESVQTVCPYCGVGCNVLLQVLDGEIVGVLPAKLAPTNEGSLCIKGWSAHEFVRSPARLTTPLIRRDGALQKAGWDEAFAVATDRIQAIVERHGPGSIAAVGSARCPNEPSYLFQKLVRAAFGHNNVDHCARL